MSKWNLRTCLGVSIGAIMLSACGGGSDDDLSGPTPTPTQKGVNGTYLFVSYQNQFLDEDSAQGLYYGTEKVGSESTQALRISNRGADIYPLKKFAIVGEHADQFSMDILEEVVLNPSEFVSVDVRFRPTTEIEVRAGQQNPLDNDAVLSIDYDTIKIVEEPVNVNEQGYYQAADLVSAGEFTKARKKYTNYLQNDPVTVNKRRAAIRLPIIEEAIIYDGQEDLGLYLEAMSQRDEQDFAAAVRTLDVFTATYPDSYLADDALYLKGYIQLIDLDDPTNALRALQVLRKQYPDTAYYDTAMYSEAIAQLDIGNDLIARKLMLEMKARHTGIDELGIQLPKDNLLSRMWFERAVNMLESV